MQDKRYSPLEYLDYTGREDVLSGGVKMVPIGTPTLVIGAQHDTMDPEHMGWMAGQFPNGRHLHCPNGSHMAMYDDQEIFFRGLIQFIRDVDASGR